MPNVSPEKVRTPAGSDNYALTADLRLLGESVRSVVPVANATERAAVASAMTAAGRPASATNPLIVDRADAPIGVSFEVTRDGGVTWTPLTENPTIANRAVQVVRADTGGAGSGSWVPLVSVGLPSLSPPGLYMVTYSWLLSNSGPALIYLRGTAGVDNITSDIPVSTTTETRLWTATRLYTHPGGVVTFALFANATSGTMTAPPGSSITVAWQGPA